MFRTSHVHTMQDTAGNRFSIKVPNAWEREHQPFAPIAFINRSDGTTLQMTPIFGQNLPPEAVEKAINALMQTANETSVEQALTLRELKGVAEGKGWYFQCTDSKVKPGGWKYMAAGSIWFHAGCFSFTVLSHHPHPKGCAEGLAIARSAKIL